MLIWHRKVFQNEILWVSKNVEFDADFEFVEKVAKNLREKSYQRNSDRKMEFFTFITECQSFRPLTFFAELVCSFFQWIQTQLWILRFMMPKEFFLLLLAFFANFKDTIGRNGSKKPKNSSDKCALELNFATINGLGEPSC